MSHDRPARPNRLVPCLALLLALALVGCGGGAAAVPTAAPTAPAAGPITTMDEVQSAVLRIEAKGGMVTRDEGAVSFVGGGSGFIIDPSGIAVTNNHVVTGAGSIRVHVGGKEKDPTGLPAVLLGASECSDLAVIQIQGGGPFRFFEWYESEIKNLLPVIAIGFPSASNSRYDTTRGSISQLGASGQTSWASVGNVLEHDARINPGNSGGPLVTEDGKLVGVNYASQREASLYFAIGRDEVRPLIAKLREGKNETSIGINGEAFVGESIAGVWVYSVQAGSPAAKAGVRPGDIVTSLGGVPVGEDGTMTDYCDVLRSNPDRPIAIEVLRPSENVTLSGELNSPGSELKPAAGAVTIPTSPPGPGPSGETPQDAAAAAVDELVADGKSTKQVAFGPDDSWIVLYERNGATSSESFPDEVFDVVRELNESNEEIKHVAFTYDGGWIILYGQNAWRSSGLGQDVLDELQRLNGEGREIRKIEFAPDENSWVILYDENSYVTYAPTALNDALEALFNDNQTIKHVAFAPSDGWVILYGRNGWQSNDVASDANDYLTELNESNSEIAHIAFTRSGGWIVVH